MNPIAKDTTQNLSTNTRVWTSWYRSLRFRYDLNHTFFQVFSLGDLEGEQPYLGDLLTMLITTYESWDDRPSSWSLSHQQKRLNTSATPCSSLRPWWRPARRLGTTMGCFGIACKEWHASTPHPSSQGIPTLSFIWHWVGGRCNKWHNLHRAGMVWTM